jgi:hypothetical protein
MIGRNVPLKRELIEQRSLFDLPRSHHDRQSRFSQRLNQRTSCVATADFFNTIGQKQTSAPHVARVKSSEFASISVRDIARMLLDRGSQIKRAGEEPWADYQSD